MKLKKIMILILAILILISTIGENVKAVTTAVIDTTKKASLTITKYEHANGNTKNVPLKGVEFTVYEIPSNIETVTQAYNYIKNNEVTKYAKTTPDSGTITFSELKLGRYFVVETKAPKNVSSKIESFLIDLPRTTDDGKGWDYDVTVYPKNVTIYGKVTLTHNTQDSTPLEGAKWKIEKKDEKGIWIEYTEAETLTTNKSGQISVENLEKGEYRLVQSFLPDGYIMDQSSTVNFTIDLDNTNKNLTAKSEKLSIEKYVKTGDTNYTKATGAFVTEKVSWKTIADVAEIISKMENYTITEKIPTGITLNESSIQVYGQKQNGDEIKLSTANYAQNIKNGQITIDFLTNTIKDYKKIIVKYDTTFNYNNTKSGEFEVVVCLKYTNNIDINGKSKETYTTDEQKAEVHTGMVKIYKTNLEGNPLQGAEFKIAISEQNAKDGIFVKDEKGNDAVATSDKDGYAIFGGLKYGENGQGYRNSSTSYWIVETKTSDEKYNLLEKPEKVTVNSNNATNLKTIINKEKFVLPLTGGNLNLIPTILGAVIITTAIMIKLKNKKEKQIETK